MRTVKLWCCLAVGLCTGGAWAQQAQDSNGDAVLDITNIMASMGDKFSFPGMKDHDKLKDFKKVTEGMEQQEGMFTHGSSSRCRQSRS